MSERSGAIPSALMAQAARTFADRIALRYGERSWTFAEFDAIADRLASGLGGHNIYPPKRVEIGPTLPKTSNGKVDKKRLRERLLGGSA